ncbi:hypothetical protein Tco_1168654 [Tanacetum coccineum]
MHTLNEKLAALSRFLSKGSDKSLLFFKALKNSPIKGEVLVIYFAASAESISVVLLAEREKRQVPIYFEDFEARSEKSRRIAKWAIELGEHDIEFKGRNSVKGQILAPPVANLGSTNVPQYRVERLRELSYPEVLCFSFVVFRIVRPKYVKYCSLEKRRYANIH